VNLRTRKGERGGHEETDFFISLEGRATIRDYLPGEKSSLGCKEGRAQNRIIFFVLFVGGGPKTTKGRGEVISPGGGGRSRFWRGVVLLGVSCRKEFVDKSCYLSGRR